MLSRVLISAGLITVVSLLEKEKMKRRGAGGGLQPLSLHEN